VISVFLSYERSDRAVANAVVSALSTAGVQIATPESAIAGADRVIVLWSIARARSNSAEQAVKLAIKAWADDRLVLAQVDEAELPLGLRDIPAIDLASDRQGGSTRPRSVCLARLITAWLRHRLKCSHREVYRDLYPALVQGF